MSIKWVTDASLPALIASDEAFTTFPPVNCELTSFESATGTIHLSDYRLIFQESQQNTQASQRALKQLLLPLHRWHSPTIGQPWFGPNFYEGVVKPVAGGGLDSVDAATVKAKFIFKEGGIEHFHKALEVAFSAARERQRNRAFGPQEEDLPAYEGAGEGPGVPPTYATGVS